MDTPKKAVESVWRAFKRLTKLGFPRRFPIVQFPNAPLIVGLAAGETSRFVSGAGRSFLLAISLIAMVFWAYEELVHGANWFRSLLGFAYLALVVVRSLRVL